MDRKMPFAVAVGAYALFALPAEHQTPSPALANPPGPAEVT
jgi:hypothetical protein